MLLKNIEYLTDFFMSVKKPLSELFVTLWTILLPKSQPKTNVTVSFRKLFFFNEIRP